MKESIRATTSWTRGFKIKLSRKRVHLKLIWRDKDGKRQANTLLHLKWWLIHVGCKERGLRSNQPLGKDELWLLLVKGGSQTRILVSTKAAQFPFSTASRWRDWKEASKRRASREHQSSGYFSSQKTSPGWQGLRWRKMDFYHEYKA